MVVEGIRVCPWNLADIRPYIVLFYVGGRFIKATEKPDTIPGLNCPAEELAKKGLN